MTYTTAVHLIGLQEKSIRKLNRKRFIHKGYEYEIRYEGGFAVFVSLYRRQIGKRNFKYFDGEGCADCIGAATALEKLIGLLP